MVLWCAFWLQSTKILPGRSTLAMTVVTLPGICRSITWPTASAKSAAASWVTPGVLSGTYICSPFDPEVLHQPSRPTDSSTSRIPMATTQHSTIDVFGPGSKSNTRVRGVSRSAASAIGAWISIAAMLAAHTIAAGSSIRQYSIPP